MLQTVNGEWGVPQTAAHSYASTRKVRLLMTYDVRVFRSLLKFSFCVNGKSDDLLCNLQNRRLTFMTCVVKKVYVKRLLRSLKRANIFCDTIAK